MISEGAIYLDHNATTPVDPRVVAAMEPYWREAFGNPSSVEHSHGHAAGQAVEEARETIARTIGAQANEIIFTGSCTEANNLALLGVARAQTDKRHIIVSSIEHPAILSPASALERDGWRVTYLVPDEAGRIAPDQVCEAITDQTVLVSIMGANNEVGTIQPIREIGAICAAKGVLFHSDLAQLAAYSQIDVGRDNIHLASFSAHKAYGPKGVGALYVRSRRPRAKLVPLIFGGGQERGLRPGTVNTAGVVGMAAAFEIVARDWRKDANRVRALCKMFWTELSRNFPQALLNGPVEDRLANNLSISIEGVEPLALMRRLQHLVSFSASSACATDKVQTSHVLAAMFGDGPRARAAFRVAPGRFTTEEEVRTAAKMFVNEIERLGALVRNVAA